MSSATYRLCDTGQASGAFRAGVSFVPGNGSAVMSRSTRKEGRMKGYMLFDFNSVLFWKRQNYGNSEKINGCQGLG